MKNFFLGCLLLFPFILFSQEEPSIKSERDCSIYSWTKDQARTQGGGFIWFPGKAKASSVDEGNLMALGQAINHLINECQFPHVEAKIHERCVEKIGDYYQVHLRISIEDRHCQMAKYAEAKKKETLLNRPLQKTFEEYQHRLKLKRPSEESCTKEMPKECYELGKYAFFHDNYEKAFTFFEIACRGKHQASCFNAGMALQKLGQQGKAKGFFALNCQENDFESCYYLGMSYLDRKDSTNAFYAFQKACKGGNPLSCHEASFLKISQKKFEEAKEFAQKACNGKVAKACYNLANLLKNHKEEAVSLYIKSCEYGLTLGCRKASSSAYDNKDFNGSLKYAIKACDNLDRKSCHNVGSLFFKKGEKDEAKKYFSKACQQGLKQSCHYL